MAGLASRQRDKGYRLRRNVIGLLLLPSLSILPPFLGVLTHDWLIRNSTGQPGPMFLRMEASLWLWLIFLSGVITALITVGSAFLLKRSRVRWSMAIQKSLHATLAGALPLAMISEVYYSWVDRSANSTVPILCGFALLLYGGGSLCVISMHMITRFGRRIRMSKAFARWSQLRCPACGYDLHAMRSSHCPECGRTVMSMRQPL